MKLPSRVFSEAVMEEMLEVLLEDLASVKDFEKAH